jgi:ankyrin repeat domain-containing protein 50
MEAMTGLSVRVFQAVSSTDLEALMVIGVLVGSGVILLSARDRWREGVQVAARTFAQFASLAYRTNTQESLDYGVRQFLVDTDTDIRFAQGVETTDRMTVLFTTLYAILATQDPRPIGYFLTVISECCEGFIGGRYEEQVFSNTTKSYANELRAVSDARDSTRLILVLAAVLEIALRSKEKRQDWFLNLIPASCLILCSNDPTAHRWLIAEGIPEILSAFVCRQQSETFRRRAFKALLGTLVIRKQYGYLPSVLVQKTVEHNLNSIEGVDEMLDQVLDP